MCERPTCLKCPNKLCTDYGNGYMHVRDYEKDTSEVVRGGILRCDGDDSKFSRKVEEKSSRQKDQGS